MVVGHDECLSGVVVSGVSGPLRGRVVVRAVDGGLVLLGGRLLLVGPPRATLSGFRGIMGISGWPDSLEAI